MVSLRSQERKNRPTLAVQSAWRGLGNDNAARILPALLAFFSIACTATNDEDLSERSKAGGSFCGRPGLHSTVFRLHFRVAETSVYRKDYKTVSVQNRYLDIRGSQKYQLGDGTELFQSDPADEQGGLLAVSGSPFKPFYLVHLSYRVEELSGVFGIGKRKVGRIYAAVFGLSDADTNAGMREELNATWESAVEAAAVLGPLNRPNENAIHTQEIVEELLADDLRILEASSQNQVPRARERLGQFDWPIHKMPFTVWGGNEWLPAFPDAPQAEPKAIQ